jgi:putative multiple sugar transport system substrate-binding protein
VVASRSRGAAAALLLCTALAAGLTGCGAAEPEGPGTIAVVLPSEDGRFGDVADELRDRLGAAGYRVDVHSTDGDIPAQVTTVGELLDEQPDGLVVWPIDGGSLTPVIDGAGGATQIIAIGGLVYDTAELGSYVGFDAAAAGFLQASAVLDGLGLGLDDPAAAPTSPMRVELFAGSPDVASTEPAYAAIMGVLQPHLDAGTLVVASGEVALADVTTLRGNEDTAASRMTRILRDSYAGGFPDAVLATSDEVARGVSSALIAAGAVPGEGFPLVTGRGAELRSLVAMLEGRQHSTLLEDPRALAAEAAARLLDALEGATPSGAAVDNGAALVPASLVQPVPVLAGTIDELVIGSGYWTRERLDEAVADYGTTAP